MEGLWARVLAGGVDSIASDHSPSVTNDKTDHAGDIWEAWGGIPGVQTMLPLLLNEGVHRRRMPLPLLARLTAGNPARQFGLAPRKGTLQPGADADLAIADLDGTWRVQAHDLYYRNRHSPYIGMTLHGTVEQTVVRGVAVFDRGLFPAAPGHGQLLCRDAC
jgi:allantoinase